jgi:hypothetical protein
MRTSACTNTLDKLINKAIRLNNNLYELQLKSRAYKLEYVSKKGKRQSNYRQD